MRMLTREEVVRRTTISNPQLYRVPDLPSPVSLGQNRVAWYEHEIDAFLLTRPRVIEDALTYPDLEPPEGVQILTEKQVCDLTSMSRANLNRKIRARQFPSPVKLSVQKIGYLKHEVYHWLKTRPRASWSLGVQQSI